LAAGAPVLVRGDGDGLAQAVADPWAWAGMLGQALGTLPASAEATVSTFRQPAVRWAC